ncbi:hypothetical protein AN391_03963 [Pseudoalteromonas sp. P1-13-1a]|uniref:hypothetical protein n=1 Tax=Pseudoalteromonas sp. P1-13-1a TaxID=1723756 RepID=UPI0006D6732D|nr:hypothetical protein [Pseudoalteromonas sp. P1-13-1a]KPZ51614.1 hypothetical protein AN391_03963 [Pseudoalteromonas sp. P1-13-1a]
MKSPYVTEQYKADPIGFLINILDAKKIENQIRNEDDILSILTGLVAYRQLSRYKQTQLNAAILAIKSGPVKEYLYGLVAQLAFNPKWFSWSMSDKELRAFFENNKDLAKATAVLGVATVGTSVPAILESLLNIKKTGVKAAAKDAIVKASNSEVGKAAASQFTKNSKVLIGSSYAAAYVTVISTFLWYCSSKNEADAKKELILRGLIKLEDI